MYYFIVLLSVVLFGGSFYFNDLYRKESGSGWVVSLIYSFLASFAGLVVLLLLNGFSFEYTPFSLLVATLASVNTLLFGYCSIMALGKINLSLYSLFSMLGGMLLPFFVGIIFYGERFTVAKVVCLVCIVAALLLTVEKDSKKSGATVYYIGVFVFNGMSGVLSKVFTSAPYQKTSAAGYSVLVCGLGAVISALLLLPYIINKKIPRTTRRGLVWGMSSGAFNRVGNFLLVLALAHIDATVQFPMVTGGVMIVSTALCFLNERKPSKKEIFSVLLAFVGLLAMFLIRI